MSGVYIEPLAELVSALSALPGIGAKTAQRLALHILSMEEDKASRLAQAIATIRARVHFCSVCGALTEDDPCAICQSVKRDQSLICVVNDPRDVLAMERMRDYNGVYHVLHGTISPVNNIGPDQIRIRELLSRAPKATEVILATNPDIEGETTASYIARLLKPMGIKCTRIAHGVPVGGDLEYIDEVTLSRAMQWRRDM